MAPSSRQEQLVLWAEVAGLNYLGLSINVLIGGWLAKNINLLLDQMDPPLLMGVWLVVGCVAGYGLGVFQIGALAAHGLKSRQWPLTTMVGLGIAYSSYAYLVLLDKRIAPAAFSLVFGVLLGGLVGWLQWLILRRRYSRAGWWVPFNIVVWVLGITSIFDVQLGSWGGVGLIAAGAVTGVVLLWLLRHPVSPTTRQGP